MRARQVRAHTTLIVRLLGGGARERDIKERERERARARAREREGENEGERANTRRYRHGHGDAELADLHHACYAATLGSPHNKALVTNFNFSY